MEANPQYFCSYCKFAFNTYCSDYTKHECFESSINQAGDRNYSIFSTSDHFLYLELDKDDEETIVKSKDSQVKGGTNNSDGFNSKEDLSLESEKWDDCATKLYLTQVVPRKSFKTKKKMWEKIAQDLRTILSKNFTFLQVENRYKTILKRKKQAVETNSQTGTSREAVPFEEELKKISALDDSIEPEVQRSATKVVFKMEVVDNIEPKTKKVKTIKSVQETIEEISNRKEANKERRHQEKMAILKELIGYLQKKRPRYD